MTDQQPPTWTNEDLRAWRQRLGLTQAEAAQALGITHRGYQKREAGDAPISREAMLACLYLEEHAREAIPYTITTEIGLTLPFASQKVYEEAKAWRDRTDKEDIIAFCKRHGTHLVQDGQMVHDWPEIAAFCYARSVTGFPSA